MKGTDATSQARFATLAILFGSFILFAVQPMLGRTLLPSFGGSAAVWTVCLASFQTLLLIGYLYAHALTSRPQRTQVFVHRLFLLLAILWTLIFAFFRPALMPLLGNQGAPRVEVLFSVLLIAGLPYVVLASGSTIVQAWLARAGTHEVYRLYAVSNLGSFLGLIAYPFIFEPHVSLTLQWWGLAGLLLIYSILLFVSVSRGAGESIDSMDDPGDLDSPDSSTRDKRGARPWLWFVVPALSVFLLNAVTSYLTLDVMPLPLLWVILLGLFLLSYVVGFSGIAHRVLPIFFLLAVASVVLAAYAYRLAGQPGSFKLNLFAGMGLCFFGCTFLHLWLYHMRPEVERLSLFYLFNAIGGAVGGLFASLAVPLMFKTVAEYPIAMVGVILVSLVYVAFSEAGRYRLWIGVAGACAGLASVAIAVSPQQEDRPVVWRERGFYGTLKVTELKAKAGEKEGVIREFVHGSTVHGIQALIPGREHLPTGYYTPEKMGFGIVAHPKFRKGEPLRVNVMGLGAGMMLAYARENDFYRCYEISPEVMDVAQDSSLFTYVSGCKGELDLVCEDGRKGLERELAAGVEPYDVIVIDAFSGDSLPYHLSTREAFELYFKMLKPDGILALNVSNWHLDLDPYVKSIGVVFECPTVEFASPDDLKRLAFAAKCAFFCREPSGMGPPPFGAEIVDIQAVRDVPMPTDEKGSFVPLIRW